MKYKNAVLHAADPGRFPDRIEMGNRKRGTRVRDFRFDKAGEKMRCWLGDGGSEEEWIRHREFLLCCVGNSGHRPVGFWRWEIGRLPPALEVETSTLWAMGAFSDAEHSEILQRWRFEFDRSLDPHFFYCGGANMFLTGPRARKAHWRWADIPIPLLKTWLHSRKHQAAQIKQLASAEL
jgi:hypothetical protein